MSDIEFAQTTSADGTALGYIRRGTGPALVITHGSVSTKEQWLLASEPLAEAFTLFIYDRRGRGQSGDADQYSLQNEVDDVRAMMEVAGPGAHLLAHSFGALVALEYVRQHGLDGGTLVAYEPPLAVDGPVAGEHLPRYVELIEAGDLEAAFEHALLYFVRVPAEALPFIRSTPLWAASLPLMPTWTRELREIDALGSDLSRYATIAAPTHLIAGSVTTPYLIRSVHELATVIPGAHASDLEGADHFGHLTNPAGFAELVVAAVGRRD